MKTDTNPYRSLLARLDDVRRRHVRYAVIEGVLAACAVGLGGALVFGLAEWGLYLAPAVKTLLFAAISGAAALTGVVLVLTRRSRLPDVIAAARLVEHHRPSLGDRLVSAVQLGGLGADSLRGQSAALVEALVAGTAEETANIPFGEAVSTDPLRNMLRAASILAGAVCLLVVMFPAGYGGALYRLADMRHLYLPPDGVSVFVVARDTAIIRGEDFITPGYVAGEPDTPPLAAFRWEDAGTWTMKPVEIDARTGTFILRIEKPRRSFDYFVEAGDARTLRFHVTVIERPDIASIEASVTAPSYTGSGTVVTRGDGSFRALTGSTVTLAVKATKPLDAMTILWGDSTLTRCPVAGDTGTATFTVDVSRDYTVHMTDTLGVANRDPVRYRITCLADEPPRIAVVSPVDEITMPMSMQFPLVYRSVDDYGLTVVALRFRLPGERDDRATVLDRGDLGTLHTGTYRWDLSRLGILPEDTIPFFLIAVDNDTVTGPKAAMSDTVYIRVPSLNDLLSDTVERQEQAAAEIRRLTDDAVGDRGELDAVRKKIMSGQDPDWSDTAAIEASRQKLEDLGDRLHDFSEELDRATGRLSAEGMIALEMIERYEEISRLMDELADGPLKEALEQLSRAAAEMDPAELKKLLDGHSITAEELRDRLNAMVAMLEQVKALQRFEMARRLVEDLAVRQADLAARYAASPGDSALVREQERLASEMSAMDEELRDMARELTERFRTDTSALTDHLDAEDIPSMMTSAARDMEAGHAAEASDGQAESVRSLTALMGLMDSLDAAMRATNAAEIARRAQAAITDLLAVSEKQEAIVTELQRRVLADENDPARERDTALQLEVLSAFDVAARTAARLNEVAPDLAGMLDQLAGMVRFTLKTAVDRFTAGNARQGSVSAESGLAGINRFSHLLMQMLEQGEQGGGGGMPGDLMQQLQQLAEGQLSLMQQMGAGMSMEQLAQLAAEQRKLADMLSGLAQEIGDDARLREMLDKLAEEMSDTSRMMRRNEDRELIERNQQDIVRRLLDARRSRREKDESEGRKSWTAREDAARGADRLADDLGERRLDLNERINRALEDDFTPAYRAMIRRYFESMLGDPAVPAGEGGTP